MEKRTNESNTATIKNVLNMHFYIDASRSNWLQITIHKMRLFKWDRCNWFSHEINDRSSCHWSARNVLLHTDSINVILFWFLIWFDRRFSQVFGSDALKTISLNVKKKTNPAHRDLINNCTFMKWNDGDRFDMHCVRQYYLTLLNQIVRTSNLCNPTNKATTTTNVDGTMRWAILLCDLIAVKESHARRKKCCATAQCHGSLRSLCHRWRPEHQRWLRSAAYSIRTQNNTNVNVNEMKWNGMESQFIFFVPRIARAVATIVPTHFCSSETISALWRCDIADCFIVSVFHVDVHDRVFGRSWVWTTECIAHACVVGT